MGLLDIFKRRSQEEPAASETAADVEELEIYSGMRVEVTTFDGRLLFVAKLIGPRGSSAELHQYSEASLPQDAEPVRVRIRGLQTITRRKAVYMEGTICAGCEAHLEGGGADRGQNRQRPGVLPPGY